MSGPVGGHGGGDPNNWVTIFQFGPVPPTAVVRLESAQAFDFQIFGAGIPFKEYGSHSGNTDVEVGWAIAYVNVQVRSPVTVNCIFFAFPPESAL
jgi:hypothetical protein